MAKSDAQSTVEFVILSGIAQSYNPKESLDDAVAVQAILKNLFSPETRWAVKEYLDETTEK